MGLDVEQLEGPLVEAGIRLADTHLSGLDDHVEEVQHVVGIVAALR